MLLHDFFTMIFPNYCVSCQEGLAKGENDICTFCRYHLPQTNFHVNVENELARKFWGKINLKYALAYLKFIKSGKVQRILHELKYNSQPQLGILLGNWYGEILCQHTYHQKFDLILPIPLHKNRAKTRGYNQSDAFAQGLSEALQVDWSPNLLVRNTHTTTQTHKKRFERWENVKNVFEVPQKEAVANKRILVVDDVVTTGATLEACLQVLQVNGAKELSIAAIAAAE